MKTIFTLFLIPIIVACSTPAEMRKETPTMTLISNKNAKNVAVCIAERWEGLGIFNSTIPVNMRPTDTGYTIKIVLNGQPGMLVDIDETTNGSSTRYYKGIVWGESDFVKIIKICQ